MSVACYFFGFKVLRTDFLFGKNKLAKIERKLVLPLQTAWTE